ncbi:MAG: hypothetical protein A2665_00975 [Candidatus Zambryskibacteria bacterium RIFCSPHIGHO2_01_FULL_46_30]|uniref:Uncharacterized protein n=1 Tax=Candidatus Zambryskibacteria bacterium RIFCSPHIGHO2_01_FULL_46_30 TaxID=1802739 RepID=A0A1G2T4Q1_9BACT|nr:MAG: hypothetical protein A2665_00975 [Candidatus Zambryskibacteria bacterium RIFCSPHIGHO2_01_FULL_46_30]
MVLARRKSIADPAKNTAKMELKTNTPVTPALPQLTSGEIISAVTGTNNCTIAATSNVSAIPPGLKREIRAPVSRTAGTAQ